MKFNVEVEILTSGQENKYNGYLEISKIFIELLLKDYERYFKLGHNYRFREWKIYKSKAEYLEDFVKYAKKYDALVYGLISRDRMLELFKRIRRKYGIIRE